MLPEIKNMTPERDNFPTKWQTVIFRNYRFVGDDVIANVLSCDTDTVRKEAARLGLRKEPTMDDFCERGYITLIRNNWFILPYDQLATLAGMSMDRLDFVVANDDFLSVKLGKGKPDCKKVVYSPLSADEITKTEQIAKIVSKYDTSERVLFDFYRDTADHEARFVTDDRHGIRMVHPYLSPCADPFINDTRNHLPDELLDDYARVGVNAIELHAVLSKLTYYPPCPSMSEGFETRRKNLKNLVERAKKRGITVILYLDEPRALPHDVFDHYGRPELGGHTSDDGTVSLCLSVEENLQYLYRAVNELWHDIPEVGYRLSQKANIRHIALPPITQPTALVAQNCR